MENEDLISVIVPIYNVENYLLRCLESLANQSYSTLEIILVNDGSTDKSGIIAKQICEQDSRFNLINQPNGGLSNARNTGLKVATGKYVAFVDSDDWAHKDFIKILHQNIKSTQSDFSCCRLSYVRESNFKEVIYGHHYTTNLLIGESIIIDALLVKNIHTPVWAKLYNLKFIKDNNLQFRDGIINEDTLFTSIVSLYAKRVSLVDKYLFYSIEREGSISRSKDIRLFLDMQTALEEVKNHIIFENKMTESINQILCARYVKSFLYNFLQSAQRLSLKDFNCIYERLLKDSKYTDYKIYIKNLPLLYRFIYKLSLHPSLFWTIFRVANKVGIRMH